MAEHNDNGRIAEGIAQRFLQARGLTSMATNYLCRYGELDLVMRDGNVLVVAEIRYRRRTGFVGPVESISAAKRRRIAKATMHFRQRHPACRHLPVRFDVVGLSGPLPEPVVLWVAGAFTIDDIGLPGL